MFNFSIPGIRFIVTSLCNYDCNYCHNEWEDKKGAVTGLEKKIIENLIVSAKKFGAKEVAITGGEPLLKMDRVEAILDCAQRNGLFSSVTTNGYFLDSFGNRLVDLGLDEIHAHIPSLNPATYKKLMNGNADLDRVLNGIEKIRGKVSVIKVNVPIQEGINDHEIDDFLDYFGQRGVTPRFIEMMSTSSYQTNGQRRFDDFIRKRLNAPALLTGSYLWGINKYSSREIDFETLRCICFDRKCSVCPETNFLHVDQDYRIRPCNLRDFKVEVSDVKVDGSVKSALEFLKAQTDVPEEYKNIWHGSYVPLTIEKQSLKMKEGTEQND